MNLPSSLPTFFHFYSEVAKIVFYYSCRPFWKSVFPLYWSLALTYFTTAALKRVDSVTDLLSTSMLAWRQN